MERADYIIRSKQLLSAVESGDLDRVAGVLNSSAEISEETLDFNIKNKYGYSLIHIASLRGFSGILSKILKYPVGDINATTKFGITPLHWACQKGEIETVRLLLSHQCDHTLLSAYGMNALHYTAMRGKHLSYRKGWTGGEYLSIARLLIETYKMDPSLESVTGSNCYGYLVQNGTVKNSKDALFRIIEYGDMDQLLFLEVLEKNLDYRQKNKKGQTLWDIALRRCSDENNFKILEYVTKNYYSNSKMYKIMTPRCSDTSPETAALSPLKVRLCLPSVRTGSTEQIAEPHTMAQQTSTDQVEGVIHGAGPSNKIEVQDDQVPAAQNFSTKSITFTC